MLKDRIHKLLRGELVSELVSGLVSGLTDGQVGFMKKREVPEILERCLEGTLFLFYSVDALGWSRVMQVTLGQEMLRLETMLRLMKSDFPKIAGRLAAVEGRFQAYVPRLQSHSSGSWPLLVVRGRRLLSVLCHLLNVESDRSEQHFQRICQTVFIHIMTLERSVPHFLEIAEFEANKNRLLQRVDFHHVVRHLWQWSKPKIGCVKGYHEIPSNIAYGRAEFVDQIAHHLIPEAGVLSLKCWGVIQGSSLNSAVFDLSDTVIIRMEVEGVEQLALHQLLVALQMSQSIKAQYECAYLPFLMVQESNAWQIVCDSKPLNEAGKTTASIIVKQVQYYLPNILISIMGNTQSKAVVPQVPVPPHESLPNDLKSRVSLVVNQDLSLVGYSFHVDQDLIVQLIRRRQNPKQELIFIVTMNNYDSLVAMSEHLLAENNPVNISLFFCQKSLNSYAYSDVLVLLDRLKNIGYMIGLWSEKPQEIFSLHLWRGPVQNLLLGDDWYQDITNSQCTIRGNAIARLRHLVQQGWELSGAQVQDYSILASLLKLGMKRLTIHPDLKFDILNKTLANLEVC